MNENCLLHNETAKKLYFEYAKDLPIIMLCAQNNPSDKVYNNIAEAFLTNDIYKLNAMRDCGVDEKYITGDASDYEKFKAFCSILPKFAGHPIYLLSHMELKKHFNCIFDINENNADDIWKEVNNNISLYSLSEQKIIYNTNVHLEIFYDYFYTVQMDKEDIVDLVSLEFDMIKKVEEFEKQGCKLALGMHVHSFEKPNPYLANETIKKIKANQKVSFEESRVLEMQLTRILGKELKKHKWTVLLPGYCDINDDVLEYLENNDALPNILIDFSFEMCEEIDDIAQCLKEYCRRYPLGKSICTVYTNNQKLSYAHNDYFRRILCNTIGKWVENGEYTSDEKTLKKLIQDILYNNLKEAIS